MARGMRWGEVGGIAATSGHAKAGKQVSESEVGGGQHLKEMYVSQVQGKGKTLRERDEVLLKHSGTYKAREPSPG